MRIKLDIVIIAEACQHNVQVVACTYRQWPVLPRLIGYPSQLLKACELEGE